MTQSLISPRAVVVDDDKVNLYYAGKILRSVGCDVVSATGYLDALNAISGSANEFLLADIRLPNGNGLELAKIARERHQDLKIILMTAYREEEFGASYAGYPVVRVPFSSRQLLNSIRALGIIR